MFDASLGDKRQESRAAGKVEGEQKRDTKIVRGYDQSIGEVIRKSIITDN